MRVGMKGGFIEVMCGRFSRFLRDIPWPVHERGLCLQERRWDLKCVNLKLYKHKCKYHLYTRQKEDQSNWSRRLRDMFDYLSLASPSHSCSQRTSAWSHGSSPQWRTEARCRWNPGTLWQAEGFHRHIKRFHFLLLKKKIRNMYTFTEEKKRVTSCWHEANEI